MNHEANSLGLQVDWYKTNIQTTESSSFLSFSGAETWSFTRQLLTNIDAFDHWCLCLILWISWRDRISDEEVRRRTDQPPLTHIMHTTRLKFFGHIACANPSMDHNWALRSSMAPLPRDWNRKSGRPRQNWLRTVESDVTPLNTGLATAYHPAQNRHGGHSWKRQHSLNQLYDDDDDDVFYLYFHRTF